MLCQRKDVPPFRFLIAPCDRLSAAASTVYNKSFSRNNLCATLPPQEGRESRPANIRPQRRLSTASSESATRESACGETTPSVTGSAGGASVSSLRLRLPRLRSPTSLPASVSQRRTANPGKRSSTDFALLALL